MPLTAYILAYDCDIVFKNSWFLHWFHLYSNWKLYLAATQFHGDLELFATGISRSKLRSFRRRLRFQDLDCYHCCHHGDLCCCHFPKEVVWVSFLASEDVLCLRLRWSKKKERKNRDLLCKQLIKLDNIYIMWKKSKVSIFEVSKKRKNKPILCTYEAKTASVQFGTFCSICTCCCHLVPLKLLVLSEL